MRLLKLKEKNYFMIADNYGMITAFKKQAKFLVFKGENSNLEYIGLGIIVDVFPNSTGKSAIFKIRVYSQ